MAKTCLQIIQAACSRMGFLSPTTAINSSDRQIQQLVALSNENGQDLCRHPWQALQAEATFTTVMAEIQCALASITTNFSYIINDTIWNRSLRRPVYGPRSQQSWQQQKAMQLNGPFNSFRIQNGEIRFYPVPVAGQTCAFEYITKSWVDRGGSGSEVWVSDTDTCNLDDELMILGIIWRFRQVKGLDYTADLQKYERLTIDALARDGGGETLSLNGAQYDIVPGIFVPAGSWGQP